MKNVKKTNPQCKNGKPSYKNRKPDRSDRPNFNDKSQTGHNDPSWYGMSPQLLKDAASIPFSWAVGTPFEMGTIWPTTSSEVVIPGLQVQYLVPSIGYSDSPSSAANIAAIQKYAYTRKLNSGSTNYDAPDEMLYILAISQVYSYINFLQRAYGLTSLYSQRNRYTPRMLLKAMGIDPDDAAAHYADFNYMINVLIQKAASLAVPDDMPIFKRHASLYKNIYTEGTSVKDQWYMYCPWGFWIFNPNSSGKGGMLKLTPFMNIPDNNTIQLKTVQELYEYGTSMLDPIVTNSEMNIMSGDIMKAWEGRVMKLGVLPSDYPIIPVFDIGVLEQMKNATAFDITDINVGYNLEGLDVTQDPLTNTLQHTPQISFNTKTNVWVEAFTGNRILTTTTAETTPELVIESTRLMASVSDPFTDPSGVEGAALMDIYSGTEIVVLSTCFQLASDSENFGFYSNSFAEYFSTSTTTLLRNVNRMAVTCHFRFHPYMNLVGSAGSGNTVNIRVFDVDNYAVLTPQVLQKMHDVAIMSELAVPAMSTT